MGTNKNKTIPMGTNKNKTYSFTLFTSKELRCYMLIHIHESLITYNWYLCASTKKETRRIYLIISLDSHSTIWWLKIYATICWIKSHGKNKILMESVCINKQGTKYKEHDTQRTRFYEHIYNWLVSWSSVWITSHKKKTSYYCTWQVGVRMGHEA